MAEIISGLVDRDGNIYKGEGFEVRKDDRYGYYLTFPSLKDIPNIVAQAWEIDDAITCVTIGHLPSPVQVLISTLDKDGNFVPNAFTFIAVSNG